MIVLFYFIMKLNAFLLALSAALLPTVVCSPAPLEPLLTEAPAPAKTVIYQLTDKLEVGGEYLIVNVNSAGDGFALSHNMDKIASDGVKIHGKDENSSVPYIQVDDVEAGSVWTATMSDNSMKLMNNNYYFQQDFRSV